MYDKVYGPVSYTHLSEQKVLKTDMTFTEYMNGGKETEGGTECELY